MLVYIYQAALLCEDCGAAFREDLRAKGKAPEDENDEGSYDSNDYPKGPTEEGESNSVSHCNGCGEFLESDLTDVDADAVLNTIERVLRGEHTGGVVATWLEHYEGSDDRISLRNLADNGLTMLEIVKAMNEKDAEIERLKAVIEHVIFVAKGV